MSIPWKQKPTMVKYYRPVHTSPSSLISCCFFGLTWRLNRWLIPLTCDGFTGLGSGGLFLGCVGSDKARAVAANASRDRG